MSTATSSALEERTVKWLLDQDNPGVRYWAFRDLLGQSVNNPEVSSCRDQIASYGPVADLLAEQHPAGYWGDPEDCYWPKWTATVWPLILLGEMGLPGNNPRVRAACEYYLKTVMDQDRSWPPPDYPEGDFTGYRSLWEPCVTGNMARTLVGYGYKDDPRVGEMFDWLVRTQLPDGGWNCESGPWGKEVHHSSFMSTIEPLWAFSALEPSKWPRGGKEAVARGCEFLLMHRLYKSDKDGRVINPEWTRLHFPLFYYYDILHGLRVLADLGYAKDERIKDALELLQSKRLPDGTWPMEGTFLESIKGNLVKDPTSGEWKRVTGQGTACIPNVYSSLGPMGSPNPWVTLNALRVLKKVHPS